MSDAEIFAARGIEFAVEPFDWQFAKSHATEIAAHWDRLAGRNPWLFDGRVLLSHRQDVADGVLRGACFETAFSRFLAWRDFGFPDPSVRNIFGMAALRGSDGAYLVGEMAAHTSSAGKVYFPAGTPDPGDVRDGRLDLADSVIRELGEETGLTPGEVDIAPGWTVVRLGPRVACLREISLSVSAREAAQAIDATLRGQERPELARMHVVGSVADALRHDMPEFMQAFFAHAFA